MKNSNLFIIIATPGLLIKIVNIKQSHPNSNHMNMHTVVIENTPRSDLQYERVDRIDYRMTRLPNYEAGI